MNAEKLLDLIEGYAENHSRVYTDTDARKISFRRQAIKDELKRLFIIDKREDKRLVIKDGLGKVDLPVEIDENGDVVEWMDVRDNIDDAEIKLTAICRQFGAFHTESLIRNITSNLQNIAHRAFGQGD